MTNRHHITLRTLSQLPLPYRLRQLAIANATLDAIIMPDWDLRYFSYNCQWDEDETMASLRNGSGAHHYILFSRAGAFLKGFDVDSPLTEPPDSWITKDLPNGMQPYLDELAFEMSDLTFCVWCRDGYDKWEHGAPTNDDLLDVPLGYLHLLLDDPAAYADWATEYYEQTVPIESVRWVQAGNPLNDGIIASLNESISLNDISEDLKEIGYPPA